MRKILYIQIDDNTLPEGCGEDVEVLDCRCINDFCSLVGDALAGDLKDENGKPLYRLINSVGKLLMDFNAVDENSFNSIIEDWYDILSNLLHKGIQRNVLEIRFPHQYVDWLLHNDNPYYEQVGKELQRRNGKITLSSEAIDDDIIASLNYKIRHTLQQKKDDFSLVVFSNPKIQNTSIIVKMVGMEDSQAYVLERIEWENQLKEASKEQISISNIDDEAEKQNLREENDLIIKVKDVSFKMIFVKGGSFTMGATYEQGSSAESRERPNHIVTLSNYFIGETVVTQALWEAIMGNNPSKYKGLNYPVQCVTWYRVQEFINRLNGLTGCNFRLPTEAEWEFAARGGIKSKNYKYAGSNDIGKVGWSNRRIQEGPHPVAQKKTNELGIYDMSGNVSEWCNDWYSKYDSSTHINPVGPSSGNKKITRGGCWYTFDSVSRVTCRRKNDPNCAYSVVGFRLALNSNHKNGSVMTVMNETRIFFAGNNHESSSSSEPEWNPWTDDFGMY